MKYALVCAPPGTGLTHAISRLEEYFLTGSPTDAVRRVQCEDVEHHLSKYVSDEALAQLPSRDMQTVTRSLPRDLVISLWRDALKSGLKALSDSESQVKLLSCHLTLYSERRSEFYSPVSLDLLQPPNSRPTHVLLFIDDVFDMYARLTRPGEVYELASWMSKYVKGVWDQEGGEGTPDLEGSVKAAVELESRTTVLARLLSWRRTEMLFAESIADQLGAHFLVAGTKQRTATVGQWLAHESPTTVYLSHPISRPRRQQRKSPTGTWPDVVDEFNGIQQDLAARSVVSIMPTAIDEFRLERGEEMLERRPRLAARWKLSAASTELLYDANPTDPNGEHAALFGYGDDVPETDDVRARLSPVLRAIEDQIKSEVPFRDHLLVASIPHILVFRPMYDYGALSRGVLDEISHWSTAARYNPRRRAVFYHGATDINDLIESTDPESIADDLRTLSLAVSKMPRPDVGGLFRDEPEDLLGGGGVIRREDRPSVRRQIAQTVGRAYFEEVLSGEATAPREQLALFVGAPDQEISAVIAQVAEFLLHGRANHPGDRWITGVETVLGEHVWAWADKLLSASWRRARR